MQVNEIMTREVIFVAPEDSVEKCAQLLQKHGISGLPVVNEEGNVVGMVTEGDLIKRASRIKAPNYLEILGGLIYLGSPKKFVDELQQAMALEAGRLMTRDVITISPEDSVEKAATLMVNQSINRLPVVDKNGKLVGIVSRRDIMNCLYDQGRDM